MTLPKGQIRKLWFIAAIVVTGALFLAGVLRTSVAAPVSKATFSIDYIVTISATNPHLARVRWELQGIHEVEELRLDFRARSVKKLRGSGSIEGNAQGARWRPGGPYGHLSYTVAIDHLRGTSGKFDSYASRNWILTRARQLFPKTTIRVSPQAEATTKSRARLIFRLPSGWRSAAPFTRLAADAFELPEENKILARPRGWLVLGEIELAHEEIADIMVQIAAVPGGALPADKIFELLSPTLPALKKLLNATPSNLLIARGPDPMWRGGISGAFSCFLHSDRPLRTPDQTSPYLHELFHVLQPNPAAADADWIMEGLAEYYSVELQRRAGLLDTDQFARALRLFERHGEWNVDLTTQRDSAATNNSAPLVMYALDQRIQHATAGKKRLDDVVSLLAQQGGSIDSERFRQAASRISGKKFNKFFELHVRKGQPPRLSEAP